MSCNYADGLKPYQNKGVLGIDEKFDNETKVDIKCQQLAEWILSAKHVVIHTGAGISTSAGIPDFRGPNGVWTLEKRGEKPTIDVSFNDAKPTKTHMALRALVNAGHVQYIVSQNIDGLHLKSGLERKYIAELHGNMFIEKCKQCRRLFVRTQAAVTVGQKPCGGTCRAKRNGYRSCRNGILLDNVLDWEDKLPQVDVNMATYHSQMADLNITLGTTLQIIPSGVLPMTNKKYGGKLVICNLQPTKYDKIADMVISTYVDDILERVCKRLGVEIPEYNTNDDPTKIIAAKIFQDEVYDWSIPKQYAKDMDAISKAKIDELEKIRKSQKPKIQKRKIKKELLDADEEEDEVDVDDEDEDEDYFPKSRKPRKKGSKKRKTRRVKT